MKRQSRGDAWYAAMVAQAARARAERELAESFGRRYLILVVNNFERK
jgi:hypothetical protein